MLKFNELIKLKAMTVFIVVVKYLLWCLFFIFQGKAIDLAIRKNQLPKQLIYILAGYVLLKTVVMLCDIFQKFLMEHYKNIELKHQWSCHIPQNIYNDNQNNKNDINILFFDYLPELFEFEISLVTNSTTISCVFVLTMAVFLYTGFFLGLFALSLVFILNFLSKNIFVKKMDDHQKEAYRSKIKILNWVDHYFSSYREISKNWQGIANSSWKEDIYKKYFISKKNQTVFYLYRDLLAQALVELPFLLNTSIVILGVYYGYLSLTQLFIWIGFSQFMINASNAYLENKVNKKQRATLMTQTIFILQGFSASKKLEAGLRGERSRKSVFSEVVMRDGTSNSLSLDPGLYHIKGGNGSGKSTLLNLILDYEREAYFFENINLSQLTANINKNTMRVIERETVIFECFDDINRQIGGPLILANHSWEMLIRQSLNRLLAPTLAKKWMKIFISLGAEYTRRKDKSMSSGEKVILSLMRFFSSWNTEVNLLIIDECDSFLDQDKKKLFIQTVQELAVHMAVYISCHDTSLDKFLENPRPRIGGAINC